MEIMYIKTMSNQYTKLFLFTSKYYLTILTKYKRNICRAIYLNISCLPAIPHLPWFVSSMLSVLIRLFLNYVAEALQIKSMNWYLPVWWLVVRQYVYSFNYSIIPRWLQLYSPFELKMIDVSANNQLEREREIKRDFEREREEEDE